MPEVTPLPRGARLASSPAAGKLVCRWPLSAVAASGGAERSRGGHTAPSPSPGGQLPAGDPAGLSAGFGTAVSVPISFGRRSSCPRPRRRRLGLTPQPAAEDRSTAVCCPVPGSSRQRRAASPACTMNGRSGSKTCCIWDFPLLLKKVPAFPGSLSQEGDVLYAGGIFFVRLRHPSGLGEAAKPKCPFEEPPPVHPIHTSPPREAAAISPCQLRIRARKKKKPFNADKGCMKI